MKILIINLPYYGHVVPTVGLVQELVRQGCEVTYLLPYGWEETASESGAIFSGYQNHRQLAEQMKNAYAAADRIAAQFDCILYEQFFFLGKHLADKHRKPAVRIFTAPVTNHTLMQRYIHAKGPMSFFRHRWLSRAFTRDVAKGIPLKTDNWLDEIIENPPALNLVYTLRDYQPYREDFPAEEYKFLGPSVYPRKGASFGFCKGERPVVYIALGTVLKGSVGFFRACIEAFRGEEVDLILSVGPKFKPEKLKQLPENVHLYRSVPQTEVLKIADCFVTHGGMNSVSEALAAGTPMVVIPFVSDQPVNAEQMEQLGVGKRLEYADATPETLRETVFAVMKSAEIRKNLAKVQNLIAQAPGNAGGARMVMEFCKKERQNAQSN